MAKRSIVPEADLKKRILAVEAERLKQPGEMRSTRAAQASLRKSRAAAEKVVSRWMTSSGVDTKSLRSIHEAREGELERLAEAGKRDALAQAAKLRNKLHPGVAGQVKALAGLAKRSSDFFARTTFTLDTPFLVWSNPLMDLDSQAAPFDSWAKFKLQTSQYQGTQKVSFYFYWVNSFGDYAVIDATTFMSATGQLKAHAPWGFWPNTSRIEAYARFDLWYGIPRELNPIGGVQTFLGETRVMATAMTGGDTRSRSISLGEQFSRTKFVVAPGQVVVFEVALALTFENDEGDVEADFQSGAFRLACPLVVFSLLNSPPGSGLVAP